MALCPICLLCGRPQTGLTSVMAIYMGIHLCSGKGELPLENYLPALQKTELLAGLPVEALRRDILPHVRPCQCAKGIAIISPRQKWEQLGVILSGRVHVLHLFADGRYSLTSVLEPGELLGADLICTKTQLSPYHAIAAEPVQMLLLPAALFLQAGRITPPYDWLAAGRLLSLVADENMKKEYRLAILSQKGLRDRIMTFLTMQARTRQTNTFPIAFSREELASYLCVNRSALSSELSRMQREGLLTYHKNIFTLPGKEPPHA